MTEEKTPGQKQTAQSKPKSAQGGQGTPPTPAPPKSTASTTPAIASKKKSLGKDTRPRVGGTAVQGAKSTQPKPAPASNDPNQQQMESSNRTMRRRMEQMGGQ